MALSRLGVESERVYVDHGFTRRNKNRAGLRDAHEIADDLASRQIKLNMGGSVHDTNDPVGKLLFNVLAMIAEFEADLISLRTREGMKVATTKVSWPNSSPPADPPFTGQSNVVTAELPNQRAPGHFPQQC